MNLEEISRRLALTVQTGAKRLDTEVTGGYASDLLSYVMANAKEGNVWVTIQSHPNIVAVASLLNLAGVVIAEGGKPEPATVVKAEKEGVPILTTDRTTFQIVGRLYQLGVGQAEG